MIRPRMLLVSAAVVFLLGVKSILADGYGMICPLYTLYVSETGRFLQLCYAYENDCEDIPDEIVWWWDEEPEPCDCPDTGGCKVAGSGNSFTNVLPPVAEKVTANGLPLGFSKRATVVKSANVYVMKDGEPVYFRILHCVFEMDGRPDHTCSYSIGFEMKSPLKGIDGLTEAKNWQPTADPNVLKLPRGDRVIYLVRASTSERKHSPTPVPTPASPNGHLEQAAVHAPTASGRSLDRSIMVKSDRPSF